MKKSEKIKLKPEQREALTRLSVFLQNWKNNYQLYFAVGTAWYQEANRYLAELSDNGNKPADDLPKIIGLDVEALDDDHTIEFTKNSEDYDEWLKHCYEQYDNVTRLFEKYLLQFDF